MTDRVECLAPVQPFVPWIAGQPGQQQQGMILLLRRKVEGLFENPDHQG